MLVAFAAAVESCRSNRTLVIAPGEHVTIIDEYMGIDEARRIASRARGATFRPFHAEHRREFTGSEMFTPRWPADVFPGVAAPIDPGYAGNDQSFMGLVCFGLAGLSKAQRAPHVDRGDPEPTMALVHYLAEAWPEGDSGGTAFYRERRTGTSLFESGVDSYFTKHSLSYNCSVNRRRSFTAECRGVTTSIDRDDRPFYQSVSDDDFELVAIVPYKFNRAVLYNTKQLHSAYIDAAALRRLSCDPSRGRLVASVFF